MNAKRCRALSLKVVDILVLPRGAADAPRNVDVGSPNGQAAPTEQRAKGAVRVSAVLAMPSALTSKSYVDFPSSEPNGTASSRIHRLTTRMPTASGRQAPCASTLRSLVRPNSQEVLWPRICALASFNELATALFATMLRASSMPTTLVCRTVMTQPRTTQQDGRAFRLEVASVGMGVMVLIKGALLKRRRTGLRDLFIVLRRVGRHPNGADNLPVRHDGHTPAH